MVRPDPAVGEELAKLEQTEMLRQHERALRSFFARRIGTSDVDDMVQEALARFLAARLHKDVEFPVAYLFRIASNLLADRGRRAGSAVVVEIGSYEGVISTQPDQEDRRRLADLQAQLTRALAELPERCREVFVMRRFRDMTTPQIANALGISPRMVQKHLARAVSHLFIRLAD